MSGNPDRVTIKYGVTVKLADFEFARIDMEYSRDLEETEEYKRVFNAEFKKVRDIVDDRALDVQEDWNA